MTETTTTATDGEFRVQESFTMSLGQMGPEIRTTLPSRLRDVYELQESNTVGFTLTQEAGEVVVMLRFNPDEEPNVRHLNYQPELDQLTLPFPAAISRFIGLFEEVESKNYTATFEVVGEEEDGEGNVSPILKLTFTPGIYVSPVSGVSEDESYFGTIDCATVLPEAIGVAESTRDEYVNYCRAHVNSELAKRYGFAEREPVSLRPVVQNNKIGILVALKRLSDHPERKKEITRNLRQEDWATYSTEFPAALVKALGLDGVEKIPADEGVIFIPADDK